MAKLTHPLHSISASGSVGKSVTFCQTKSGSIAKRWGAPSGIASENQEYQRAKLFNFFEWWRFLSAEEKQAELLRRDEYLGDWENDYPDSFLAHGGRSVLTTWSDWQILIAYSLVDA